MTQCEQMIKFLKQLYFLCDFHISLNACKKKIKKNVAIISPVEYMNISIGTCGSVTFSNTYHISPSACFEGVCCCGGAVIGQLALCA